MSVPLRVDDGVFTVALQDGAPEFSYPFADKGDSQTFIAHVKKRIHTDSYRKPTLMQRQTFNLGNAYLVDPGEPRYVGCGLLEWVERYASVPITRTEYGSTVYTQQLLSRDSSVLPITWSVEEYSAIRDAKFVYEYSLNKPLATKIAPRWITLGAIVVGLGGIGQLTFNQDVLAEDTTSEIWLAKIYCRRSTIVKYLPLVEIGPAG